MYEGPPLTELLDQGIALSVGEGKAYKDLGSLNAILAKMARMFNWYGGKEKNSLSLDDVRFVRRDTDLTDALAAGVVFGFHEDQIRTLLGAFWKACVDKDISIPGRSTISLKTMQESIFQAALEQTPAITPEAMSQSIARAQREMEDAAIKKRTEQERGNREKAEREKIKREKARKKANSKSKPSSSSYHREPGALEIFIDGLYAGRLPTSADLPTPLKIAYAAFREVGPPPQQRESRLKREEKFHLRLMIENPGTMIPWVRHQGDCGPETRLGRLATAIETAINGVSPSTPVVVPVPAAEAAVVSTSPETSEIRERYTLRKHTKSYSEFRRITSNTMLREILQSVPDTILEKVVLFLNKRVPNAPIVSVTPGETGMNEPTEISFVDRVTSSPDDPMRSNEKSHRPQSVPEILPITLDELKAWLKSKEYRGFLGLQNPKAVGELLELLKVESPQSARRKSVAHKLMGVPWPPDATPAEQLGFAEAHHMAWADFLTAQRLARDLPTDRAFADTLGITRPQYVEVKKVSRRVAMLNRVGGQLGFTSPDDARGFRQFALGIPLQKNQVWLEACFLPDTLLEEKHRKISVEPHEKIDLEARRQERGRTFLNFFSDLRMRHGLRGNMELAVAMLTQLSSNNHEVKNIEEESEALSQLMNDLSHKSNNIKIVQNALYVKAIADFAFADNKECRDLCIDFLTNQRKYYVSAEEIREKTMATWEKKRKAEKTNNSAHDGVP